MDRPRAVAGEDQRLVCRGLAQANPARVLRRRPEWRSAGTGLGCVEVLTPHGQRQEHASDVCAVTVHRTPACSLFARCRYGGHASSVLQFFHSNSSPLQSSARRAASACGLKHACHSTAGCICGRTRLRALKRAHFLQICAWGHSFTPRSRQRTRVFKSGHSRQCRGAMKCWSAPGLLVYAWQWVSVDKAPSAKLTVFRAPQQQACAHGRPLGRGHVRMPARSMPHRP